MYTLVHFTSVAQSCPTLRPHGLQYTRLLCPSPTPRVCSNSCPSSQWCHPSILSSAIPFSSCLQSFPASGSYLRSQLFASGGQSFVELQLHSLVLPVNILGWFPLVFFIIQLRLYFLEAYRSVISSNNGSDMIFFSFIFISWRLITLQYSSGFCHTLTWISHGFTCIPHPDSPSHLPLYLMPLGIETCILSMVKRITSPGWVHETSARAWCTVIWYFYIFVLYIHSFNKASYILVTIVDRGDTDWTKWRCTLGKS